MPPTLAPRRTAGIGLLHLGVLVFVLLAAFTARSVWLAWRARTGDARAAAVFDLVEQRTPPRPTEAPGAMAWLRLELERFGTSVAPDDAASRYRRLVGSAEDTVPQELTHLADAMRTAGMPAPSSAPPPSAPRVTPLAPVAGSRRAQDVIVVGTHQFVATYRRRTAAATTDLAETISPWLAPLDRAADLVEREMNVRGVAGVGATPARVVRVYVVTDDGGLVSWPAPGNDPVRVVEREAEHLSARPGLPAFAPQEFFFRGDATAVAGRVAYSGFYLDLGGRGLVSTLTASLPPAGGAHAVLALDLAFDVDWRAFARSIEAPVVASIAENTENTRAPWAALATALPRNAPDALRSVVSTLAARERAERPAIPPAPVLHAVAGELGAVAAFQVAERTWVLAWFPRTVPAFPLAAVVLLGLLLAALLAAFEVNRRRAEVERARAERALAEKQNLLNTMQIPLVVVDPNSDVLVSSNRAADALGLRPGARFADFVAPTTEARAHYERMQVATTAPRRAYGVPMVVLDDFGARETRYALVRSVAVTAPIHALAADERHRLGVLFLLEPESDLVLLTREIENDAHADERRRLAGLLSHGVDTLASVLEYCLARRDATPSMREFTAWLSGYVERRLHVVGWLFEHWDATPPLPPGSVIDGEQAAATLDRLQDVFAVIRDDRELRSRLHWDNGTLAGGAEALPFAVDVDWPQPFEITCPVRGGFGLFLGEVLGNAMRHGAPGCVPRLTVVCDRARGELAFRVENETGPSGAGRIDAHDTYGGLAVLAALSRLSGWSALDTRVSGSRFVAEWTIPAGRRMPGQAD